jgi:hypothetical protein
MPAKKSSSPKTAKAWFAARVKRALADLGSGKISEEEAIWLAGFLVWGMSRDEAIKAIASEPSAQKPLIKLASHEVVQSFAPDLTTRVYGAMTNNRPVP